MRPRSSKEVVVTALLVVSLAGGMALAQAVKPQQGAATPQEAVATIKRAAAANDATAALPVVSPAGLKTLASEGVTGVLMVLAFSDPDDAMPGSAKPSSAELAAKRKKYQDVLTLAKQTLKPYGLDVIIGKPVLAAETQKTLDTTLDKLGGADNLALVTSLLASMKKMGPMLGLPDNPKPPLLNLGSVTGYKITGDKATALNGAETINFSRIGGRWYLEPPADANAQAGGGATSPGGQGAGRAAAPPARATASGNQPEVVVGGIQIVKVVISGDDFSAKPFHADNGTRIALWVKMPAGQGLIEIDERASLLQHFGDDKGTNLGGKFDSFPDELKDGSGGTIEIESSGFPAQGATSLTVEGTLAMTVASGTRKTRVANVQLRNDAKFMFGTTSVTVAEVETEGENQKFTLKLPRSVMAGIKEVVFLDARGQPIEGHGTGRGYMNDAAEMGFTVKTALKTLTIEFEAWQGLKTIKVPFNIKAGIGG
jgi:hypothetical protein